MMKRFLLAFLVVIMALVACSHPTEAKTKTDWEIVQQLCKKTGKKIKLIESNKMTDKEFWKVIDHRAKASYVVVEKVVSTSKGNGYGYYRTRNGKTNYIIGYNKVVSAGKKVTSYVIWNPKTNECDDILWVVDNQKYR